MLFKIFLRHPQSLSILEIPHLNFGCSILGGQYISEQKGTGFLSGRKEIYYYKCILIQ